MSSHAASFEDDGGETAAAPDTGAARTSTRERAGPSGGMPGRTQWAPLGAATRRKEARDDGRIRRATRRGGEAVDPSPWAAATPAHARAVGALRRGLRSGAYEVPGALRRGPPRHRPGGDDERADAPAQRAARR